MSESITSVYFDGLCPLCSREIDHYRQQTGAENLRFIDITSTSFNPGSEGVDPKRVHEVMHVKSAAGELRTGVDAFIQIWEILPRYQWAARLAKKLWVKPWLKVGYTIFAKIRPLLPRKNRDCESSPYCTLKEKP